MLMGEGEKSCQPFSSSLERRFMPAAAWEAPTEKQSPFTCLRYCSDPCLQPVYVQAICPLSSAVHLLFILACCFSLKTANSRDQHGMDPCWSLRERSHFTGAGAGLYQKGSCTNTQELVFRVKHSKKRSVQVSHPQQVSLP